MKKWKAKKVLVTGADGFIGSHLVEELVQQGAQVKAFVYYNSFNSWGWLEDVPRNTMKNVEILSGDIRDPHGVAKAMCGVDVVFHLAALIGIPFSYYSPDSYVDTNIKGTLNVLQAARMQKVKRIIHTSTSEVYGTAQFIPITEKHPICPQSPYAATKSAADDLAMSFYKSFNLPVSILRPFNTFGPRQSSRAVIPTIISQIYAGNKTIKLGNLDAVRDLNYVQNTVDAFLALGESSRGLGEVYNTGSGEAVSIREVIDIIRDITQKKFRVVIDKTRIRPKKSEVESLVCDALRLKQSTGWKPKTSLRQGLSKTSRWIKRNLKTYKTDIYNV